MNAAAISAKDNDSVAAALRASTSLLGDSSYKSKHGSDGADEYDDEQVSVKFQRPKSRREKQEESKKVCCRFLGAKICWGGARAHMKLNIVVLV